MLITWYFLHLSVCSGLKFYNFLWFTDETDEWMLSNKRCFGALHNVLFNPHLRFFQLSNSIVDRGLGRIASLKTDCLGMAWVNICMAKTDGKCFEIWFYGFMNPFSWKSIVFSNTFIVAKRIWCGDFHDFVRLKSRSWKELSVDTLLL